MAITARTSINPTTMTDNWSKGVGGAGTKWLLGIESPRELPNAHPIIAADNWLTGVTAAKPSYEAGMSAPDYLTKLDNGAKAKQGSYTGSGTARKANFAAAAAKLAPMIETARRSLPPKGPKGTNSARSTAFAEAMHKQKGEAKVR